MRTNDRDLGIFLSGTSKFQGGPDGISWKNIRVTAKSVQERQLINFNEIYESRVPNGKIQPVRILVVLVE